MQMSLSWTCLLSSVLAIASEFVLIELFSAVPSILRTYFIHVYSLLFGLEISVGPQVQLLVDLNE